MSKEEEEELFITPHTIEADSGPWSGAGVETQRAEGEEDEVIERARKREREREIIRNDTPMRPSMCQKRHSMCQKRHSMCQKRHSMCQKRHSMCQKRHSMCQKRPSMCHVGEIIRNDTPTTRTCRVRGEKRRGAGEEQVEVRGYALITSVLLPMPRSTCV